MGLNDDAPNARPGGLADALCRSDKRVVEVVNVSGRNALEH